MKSSARQLFVLGLLLLVVGTVILSGCATQDSENLSERPWDQPKNWENGMPSSMTEGR